MFSRGHDEGPIPLPRPGGSSFPPLPPRQGLGAALATLLSVKCKLKNKQGDADAMVGGAGRPKDSRSASNSNLLLTFLCSLGPGGRGPTQAVGGRGDLWDMGVQGVGHPHLTARGTRWPVLDADGVTPVWPGLCPPTPRGHGGPSLGTVTHRVSSRAPRTWGPSRSSFPRAALCGGSRGGEVWGGSPGPGLGAVPPADARMCGFSISCPALSTWGHVGHTSHTGH